MIYELEKLFLKAGCLVRCVGWGGETNRERLDDKMAVMMLDTETRTIDIAPTGRGEAMTIPLENALQWKPKLSKKPAGTRTSTATPAKA